MTEIIRYEEATLASSVLAKTVTTSETTILTITDMKMVSKSQLSLYLKTTLGSATSLKIRYYFSPDMGTTYYQIPIKNVTTGQLQDIPSVVDSTSPVVSAGVYSFVEDIPVSGAYSIKITGQAVAASATVDVATAIVRDN